MPYATANDGTRLYYEAIGSGEPLLLVSGQGGDHHSWNEVRDDFASSYRVIVYDHRGTGASDKPKEPPYSTRGFAADAIAILDHLQIARAHAYGFSMGGRICQWLGIDYPDRIGALVLGATTPGNAYGVRREFEVDAAMASGNLVAMLNEMVSQEWMALHPEYVEMMAERARHPLPAYAQRLHYLASEGHDAWDLLPSIAAPTLVIHGDQDRINVTPNALLLVRRIPRAELYLVRGARHAFYLEFREEASRVVNGFLARHAL